MQIDPVATRIVEAAITPDPIDLAALRAAVQDPAAGALVVFEGVVRNHDAGKQVACLEYSAHPEATQFMRSVVERVSNRQGIRSVGALHRIGALEIGDCALAVVVAGEHREETFKVASELVDEIKSGVPVWKKQVFPDNTHEWSNCA